MQRSPEEPAATTSTSIPPPGPASAPPPPPPVVEAAEEEKPHRKHSFFKELPVLVVIAFAIALLIKTFLLQAFYIPSASMEPTLKIGDRVLVEKVSYRIGEPSRGDVVVFEKDLSAVVADAPEEEQSLWEKVTDSFKGLFGFPTGTAQDFIKRVIGVEGDRVEGKDGKVFVNGQAIDEPYLPEGASTLAFPPIEVPEDTIFVMGDNRNNSDDSRNFGPIPVDTVVGHAFILIWPPADFGTL